MRIATWNVNSIRTRLQRVLDWLKTHQPDVLCLQELKVTDNAFPREPIVAAGYHCAVHGQKTYNGVAVLSRTEMQDIAVGIGEPALDSQARLVAATVDGARVLSAYVPNGARVGSDKWDFKLAWLRRLRAHLTETLDPSGPVVLAGDLNVATTDADVANPDEWANTVLCHPDARSALAEVAAWGLHDAFAHHHPQGGVYSWWDYRGGAFHKNDGLRIDHILTTGCLLEKSEAAWVDRDERRTGPKDDPRGKPSDHAPLVVEFAR
ncbi:MAG: exodeoxyribonuclease III [Phycisphaerae bacterium]